MAKLNFDFIGMERGEASKAGKFILGFTIIFAVIYLALFLLPTIWFESATAHASAGILRLLGVEAKVEIGATNNIALILIDEIKIMISELCTGVLEIIVLVVLILASFGIALKKRIIGVIGALFTGIAFNQLRIVASVLIILNSNLQIAELAHNFLFRIFLFFVIVGYYAIWFWWAIKREKGDQRAN